MFRSKTILWITFAFCVTTGSCTDLVKKIGEEVKLNCTNLKSKNDLEWKFNNSLLLARTKHGSIRRGNNAERAVMEGTSLKLPSLMPIDSGVYTCGSSSYTLYVASASANPSSVLYSSETKLSCDAGGLNADYVWFTPQSKQHSKHKDVNLTDVTADDAGAWTCFINNKEGKKIIQLKVPVTVVGPLKTSEIFTISEGGTAELLCFLPAPSSLPITGGSWTRDPPSDVLLPALMKTPSGVQWNSTHVKADKVSFSDQKLNTNFTVMLKKVTLADAGLYVCSLTFDGGKFLKATLNLIVTKRNAAAVPAAEDSKVKKNATWNQYVWGMQLWIWIAVAVSSLLLIVFVIVALLIYRRNKRLKRKMRKSMKQSLKPRNYCNCDRSVRTVKQPGTGKKGRPPPLPRHQYNAL